MEKKKRNWLGYVTIVGVVLVFLAYVTNSNEPQNSYIEPTPPPSETESVDAEQPEAVVVDAGSPLPCELLDGPKIIDNVEAAYSCAAPGAYLASVDVENSTAEYFTTNTQSDTVTYGPETVGVLENSE